jgi:hypothetical protein
MTAAQQQLAAALAALPKVKKRSQAEIDMERHLRLHGIEFKAEHRFGAEGAGGEGKGLRTRLAAVGLKDWRFDFCLPQYRIAIEVEGGGWTGGRHTTGTGFDEDLQKYDAAVRLGWTVYRCSPAMVKSGKALETVLILVEMRKGVGQ